VLILRTLKSIGGRDEFLNREFVKIVDSDPDKWQTIAAVREQWSKLAGE